MFFLCSCCRCITCATNPTKHLAEAHETGFKRKSLKETLTESNRLSHNHYHLLHFFKMLDRQLLNGCFSVCFPSNFLQTGYWIRLSFKASINEECYLAFIIMSNLLKNYFPSDRLGLEYTDLLLRFCRPRLHCSQKRQPSRLFTRNTFRPSWQYFSKLDSTALLQPCWWSQWGVAILPSTSFPLVHTLFVNLLHLCLLISLFFTV